MKNNLSFNRISSNISSYLAAAENLKIALFDHDDLKLGNNQLKVKESVMSLKKKVNKLNLKKYSTKIQQANITSCVCMRLF